MRTSLFCSHGLALAVAFSLAACGGTPRANADAAEQKADAKAQPEVAAKKGADGPVRAVAPSPEKMAEAKKQADAAKKAAPLTQEELDLIAANPRDLSVEDRIKRGHALRKKIMQNPDSAAAKQLEELRRAHAAGELDSQLPPPKNQSVVGDADVKFEQRTRSEDDANRK